MTAPIPKPKPCPLCKGVPGIESNDSEFWVQCRNQEDHVLDGTACSSREFAVLAWNESVRRWNRRAKV